MRFYFICTLLLLTKVVVAEETPLANALLFHASFDESPDADFAVGEKSIYTAQSLKREKVKAGLHSPAVSWTKSAGRHGGSLAFAKKSEQIVFFQGAGNVPATDDDFQGTFSFWLRLSPADDLPPGYVDPLQITDKKWNDASFFVDFTKELPRKFRLGAFSDFKFWNPENRKVDDIPDSQRPLVTVTKLPFAKDQWTHVGITFSNFNGGQQNGVATLYLNGRSQGDLKRKQHFTWSADRLAIMLGIYYVGGFDDLAIFDRPLTAAEMQQVYQLPAGIKSLTKAAAK